MWSIWKKDHPECVVLRDALENLPQFETSQGLAALPQPQQEHLKSCADCQAAADERLMGGMILRGMAPTAAPDPWFAQRVMAAIATREAEVRQKLETWAVLPRLAARVSWASALALLLIGTWVLESPRFARNSSAQATTESLFEAPQPASADDLLLSVDRNQ